MDDIRVVISGAGKMGVQIAHAIAEADGMTVDEMEELFLSLR